MAKATYWDYWWEQDKCGKRYKLHQPKRQGGGFPRQAMYIPQKQQVLLLRIRIGNCLNKRTLFRFKSPRAEDPNCDNCHRPDSTTHRIIHCEKHSELRSQLRESLRSRWAALDPEFAFPIFGRGTTDQAKAECYKLFTKFITDAELDNVFIFQDKDTVGGIT